MSKIGNERMRLQEGADYQFGWESAERGEPFPQWTEGVPVNASLTEQRLGWQDYHTQDQQP